MRNIKLIISYDGTDFSGWQRQPALRTVQQALEEAIGRLTGAVPTTNARGRTDAGVHALGQVVQFYTAARHSTETFTRALNAILPGDIRVKSAEEKPQAFHSTFDFLSNRGRTSAGTLSGVGRGRRPEGGGAEALAAEDRAASGPTAPSQGLFLVRVRYPGDP